MRVTPPAVAAFAKHDALTVLDNLRDNFAGLFVNHDRAERHFQNTGLAVATMLIGAEPMLTAFRAAVRRVFVINEIVCVVVAEQHDVAASTAIATVGTTPRFEFLASEAHAAAPAVAGRHFNHALIDKHISNDAERPSFAKGVF